MNAKQNKKYPIPPFKKYIKTESGKIMPAYYGDGEERHFEPREKQPGWEMVYDDCQCDDKGNVVGVMTCVELVVATADTKEELEVEK